MDLIQSLKKHEGFRGMPYLCPAGKRTIGYGCRLPFSGAEAELILRHRVNRFEVRKKIYLYLAEKETIGYGCKLPISKAEAELLLRYRVSKIERSVIKRLFNVWYDLPKTVKEVLIEMAYQMGVAGLFKFKKTMKFIRAKSFRAASIEMIDSQWARRYSMRAFRLSKKMRSMGE